MSKLYFSKIFSAGGFVVALGLMASPAAAQNICGGMGNNGAWIGGIEAASDIATAAGPFDTNGIIPANGEMITLFSVSQPASVRVEAKPDDSSDSVIDLLDSTGALILTDDDGGGGLASRGETELQPGSYCLITRGIEGSSATVEVRVGLTEHAALTVGASDTSELEACTVNTPAQTLSLGALPSSATGSANAAPYYGFNLNSPMAMTFTATNDDADPVLYLYDAQGSLLAENDDSNGLSSRIDMTTELQPGYYCLGVRALSDSDLPITVEVNEFNEQDYLNSLYSSGETSPPLDGSYPVANLDVLETRLREDVTLGDGISWYQVELFDGDLMLVEAIAVGEVDPTLVIFDDLGRELGRNDDYGDGLNSQIAVPLAPGIYVIGVGQVGDQPGGMVRLALQRFVRARR